MQQKYNKQKQTANAHYVNNLTQQQTTLYQHAQYWQNDNTQGGIILCVLNYTWTCAKKLGWNKKMNTDNSM
jgi:hypothetical protein